MENTFYSPRSKIGVFYGMRTDKLLPFIGALLIPHEKLVNNLNFAA